MGQIILDVMYHFPWYLITSKWKIMDFFIVFKSYPSQNKMIYLKIMSTLWVKHCSRLCGCSMNRKDKVPCITEFTLLKGMIEQKLTNDKKHNWDYIP